MEIVLLPPNTAAVTQPLDAGIIYSFKRPYRHRLLQQIVSDFDEDNVSHSVTSLEALWYMKDAWNKITSQTVTKLIS